MLHEHTGVDLVRQHADMGLAMQHAVVHVDMDLVMQLEAVHAVDTEDLAK